MRCIDCIYLNLGTRTCQRHAPTVNRINSRQSDFPTVRADTWCGEGYPKDARCENCRYSSVDFDGNLECNHETPATEQNETHYVRASYVCGQYQFTFKAAECPAKVVEKTETPGVEEEQLALAEDAAVTLENDIAAMQSVEAKMTPGDTKTMTMKKKSS